MVNIDTFYLKGISGILKGITVILGLISIIMIGHAHNTSSFMSDGDHPRPSNCGDLKGSPCPWKWLVTMALIIVILAWLATSANLAVSLVKHIPVLQDSMFYLMKGVGITLASALIIIYAAIATNFDCDLANIPNNAVFTKTFPTYLLTRSGGEGPYSFSCGDKEQVFKHGLLFGAAVVTGINAVVHFVAGPTIHKKGSRVKKQNYILHQ